ncbi:MAG: DinB family protein [Acidobacteriota bacterium]
MQAIGKPATGEYAPYAAMYIDLLPDDGRVLEYLRKNFEIVRDLTLALSEDQLLSRYAPGKWTIKEILVHIVDDERIYAYRALRFARGDTTELPGFEQDAFAAQSAANGRELSSILAEYSAVRDSTIALFDALPSESLTRTGVADGTRMSVRAIAHHIAGHELHHLRVIREHYL